MKKLRLLVLSLLMSPFAMAQAEVELTPEKDNSIYSESGDRFKWYRALIRRQNMYK